MRREAGRVALLQVAPPDLPEAALAAGGQRFSGPLPIWPLQLVSLQANQLLQVLVAFKFTTADPFPSNQTLAAILRRSVREVRRLKAELQSAGLVEFVEKPGTTDRVTFAPALGVVRGKVGRDARREHTPDTGVPPDPGHGCPPKIETSSGDGAGDPLQGSNLAAAAASAAGYRPSDPFSDPNAMAGDEGKTPGSLRQIEVINAAHDLGAERVQNY